MFACQKSYGIRDCLDGTSNTICFGETLVGVPNNNLYRGNGFTGSNGTGYADVEQVGLAALQSGDLAGCNSTFQAQSNITSGIGQSWLLGNSAYTIFNTIVPPNSTQYKWSVCRFGCGGCSPDSSNYMNAASNHSGGANFLMTDGSVKFIKDSVAWVTYWSIGTRANGEVVDASSY